MEAETEASELESSALYPGYQAVVRGDRMLRNLAVGAWVVFGLNTLFIALDYVAYPDQFFSLLVTRLGLNVFLILLCVWLARGPDGQLATYIGCYTTGFGLVGVIGIAGGVTTHYAPGVTLLFLGMPVLLPLNAKQAAYIVGPILAAFAALPLATGLDAEWATYLVHLVFPVATAIECIASCAVLDRMRFADFCQRAELEQARDRLAALDEAKARFSANVHHELRTPLTLILAPLEALRSGEFGEVSQLVGKTLRTMHVNGQRLLKMINNLLDLAKVESRSFEIHRRPVDLTKIIGDVVDGAADLAQRKGLEISLEVAGGTEALPRINADPDAIEKVVMNLVGNALKFTEDGGAITVSIEPGGEVDGFDGVRVSVRDTGVGLALEQLDRVFDRFSQVDSSATRKHEGTGIGLSLALELVELHGGRIWAESEGEGCGATMIFLLPVGEADEGVEEEVLRDEEGRGVKLGTSIQAVEADLALPREPGEDARFAEMERSVQHWESSRDSESEGAVAERPAPAVLAADAPEVLIVEDNPDMRELLVFLVGREYRTRSAGNGREALERVSESVPDLVLTDVMMPEMSGTELCRELKSRPETSAVPVVLVTSKAEGEMKVEGLELGADDYVTKPFHPRELMARVRSLVLQRCLRLELAERNAELETALSGLEQAQVQLVQSERLAAVGELAAGIAHEVNNPVNFALNAVRAMKASLAEMQELSNLVASIDWSDETKRAAQMQELEQLQQELGVGELTDTLSELSGIIGEGLTRTHSLVGDLRDFAAPGARGIHGSVDVGKGLASTAHLLKHQLRDTNAELQLDVPADLPDVQGDSGALNQVFLNLIKNAAESLAGGGGSIGVEASVDAGIVRVRVRDDGAGMSPDVQRRLFEPFFTTKAGGHGTGLGLSICKQIVGAHGGTLEVESTEGEGTCMTVALPVEGTPAGPEDGVRR
jgi:signal transduction histidine kinase